MTIQSKHKLPVVPNLSKRNLTRTNPDKVYWPDINYIWTAEGWFYLAVIIGLFSRKSLYKVEETNNYFSSFECF